MLLLKQLTRSSQILFLALAIFATGAHRSLAQQPARDVSKESARATRDWVRDGVVYEIYPRAFSQQGDFNGVTARLDNLKELGVTILWLMPIHPIGQERRKEPSVALTRCAITMASIRITAPKPTFSDLSRKPTAVE